MEEKPKKKTPQRNARGQFIKGKEKTGGRQPGTKNKYGSIRDRLKDIIMPYLEPDPENMTDPKVHTLAKDLMAIDDPNDRVHAVAAILPYVVPKYTATTITADANRPIDEEQQLLELDRQYTKKDTTLTLRQVTIVNNDSDFPSPAPARLADYDPDEDDDFSIDDIR